LWQRVDGLGETLTRGTIEGLPVLAWGWADPAILATRRQLPARGLRPGGADPVAALQVPHHTAGCKTTDVAPPYLTNRAARTPTATPAQRAGIAAALAARRTCRDCQAEQPYYLSTISRLCADCEDRSDFWARYAAEHGYSWEVAV